MTALWDFVFGNRNPVEVEIGPGTGTFLLAAAARDPQVNFLGIEHSHSRAARLAATLETHALPNARVIAADAACVLAGLVPGGSVAAYHIYFPDPWWKRRHFRRRLLTPALAATLAHTLADGGHIYVATDVPDVFALALQTLGNHRDLAHHADPTPPRPSVTAFERKGLARGATITEATFVKRAAPATALRYTSNAAPITPAESPS